ncbi:Membrane-bound lytic murein transglycosylase D precursor [Candidatus Nitrotoga sp. BS]|uniref:transglycosylase SLT domain-containing protein n=1 Tax=Candidatus Nitrotoga sp. BS TaxID=2890408 RepID=UPI001EF2A215|nr:transglycosylase SLT domain-containing protein [Candidatus Nitrotoga sp. BS]CAH1204206.1 Membrane-bound lytic murein transglycosylase D precursor [Candidatus Nitrotoga sp. BS]
MLLNKLYIFAFSACIALNAVTVVHAEENIYPDSSLDALQADSTPQPAATSAGLDLALTADLSFSQNDLWQRIRNGYALRKLNSPLVANHEQWYAKRPDYMQRMTERGERYLHFIVEEVERRGMPSEIALLPMIESAFNPSSYSTSSASGIWQFIPSTGKHFGMRQNWWYDGRRNIISATTAALDYLQKLHGMFGDWELALAAYNWGEGAVQRALAHNRKLGLPANYANLKMPSETRNYLPKLQAIKNIIDNPANFGLALHPVADQPYFVAVSTSNNIDMELAAGLADVTLDEFRALNPAHSRPVILQENSEVLLLPVDKAETFRANLASNSLPLVSWQAYKIRKGEHLNELATRFGLSPETLRSVNGLSTRLKVNTGQMLLVPLNGQIAENKFESLNNRPALANQLPGKTIKHTVRKGDTLSTISRLYKVSVEKLQSWNNNVRVLNPGQHIFIRQLNKSY